MGAAISTTGKIANGEHVNEWRKVGDQWVNKYSILGTTIVDYAVWEADVPTAGSLYHNHSTITYRDSGSAKCLGDVTTRDIPAEMDALPAYSEARSRAVVAWYDANKALARALIYAAFPEDF